MTEHTPAPQPLSGGSDVVSRDIYEAMLDSQYRAGAKAGWNAAQLPEPEASAKFAQLIKVEAGDLAALRRPKHTTPDAALIADAIELCDWSGCSIGNKEILKSAVSALRGSSPTDDAQQLRSALADLVEYYEVTEDPELFKEESLRLDNARAVLAAGGISK